MAEESKQSLSESGSTNPDEENVVTHSSTIEESPTHEVLTEDILKDTAEDFTSYLLINNNQERQQLDERIQSIVFRVEEFQRQLEWMHQNVTSTSEKVSDIHLQAQEFKELFQKIDQIEAFVSMVTGQVDKLEETVNKAEKELGTNKIRKVFSVFPGVRKPQRRDSSEPWQRPSIFNTKEFFVPPIRTIEGTALTDQ